MAQPPTRSLMKILFQNFMKSFKPRQMNGTLMGEDYHGNKYYEIPADETKNKRKTSRWFEPPEKENHEQELTAEWESWLRGRRKDPPTDQELMKNLAIIHLKQKNAAKLAQIHGKVPDEQALEKNVTGAGSFPRYGQDYEIMPGKNPPKNYKN